MPKRRHTSLYYADDRDVSDLLRSSSRSLQSAKLLMYLRQRGIVLPPKATREYIIEQLSLLSHGWCQVKALLEMTDSADRAEKKTSRSPVTSDGLSEALAHFEALQKERSQHRDEVYTIDRHKDKSLIVRVQYTELDTRMTRLFQRRQREITFQIVPTASGLKIRHEANAKANSIASEFLEMLAPRDGASVGTSSVDLSAIRDPVIRTNFFMILMTQMPGFRFEDVEYLDVDRIAPAEDMSHDDEELTYNEMTNKKHDDVDLDDIASIDKTKDESDDVTDGSSAVDEIKQMTNEALDMKGAITQATFRGEGLLQSQVYIHLKEKGYFISHSIWVAVEDKANGKRVEFQAQFENGPEASGFKYSVRKVHERFSDGRFKKGHVDLSLTDIDIYESIIENSAESALVACIESSRTQQEQKTVGVLSSNTTPSATAKIDDSQPQLTNKAKP